MPIIQSPANAVKAVIHAGSCLCLMLKAVERLLPEQVRAVLVETAPAGLAGAVAAGTRINLLFLYKKVQ